ncbi:von Willebrand factor type A domain-containing protein [Mariniflexile fucanivorans]|uniref:von Willebrand factor type A domain-containing protein n=1 Tax=Mariniflexile fucanivorans TaxID=264023 RepID=A0A4R1RSJ5_9FLAO|nr:vWA domain-containing protein [Mariniflexile fucanivorans]TCL69000.1 von Willebrand factor type A domain-containing protein [Mariniflexile fucanivorans]
MKTHFKTLVLGITLIGFTACNANNKKQPIEYAKVETLKPETNKQYIKVALLLDTSNSMDGLIDQAKAQLWDIVNELSYAKCGTAKPNLEIALYEYGNDRLNSAEGYIRQVLAFSNDLDEISKELFSLTTNGGEEYCGQVIQTSINQLNWGKNADDLKLIFIAGNEPFTQGKLNYKDASINAKEKDITINTIFCGDYNQGISTSWKDGAALTNGDYMAINQNKTTVHIVSPYDDEILILNQKLNKTYVIYGSKGKQKMELQAEQDNNAQGYSKANAVSRTVSKSSHLYKNETWDLVDAVELKKVSVETLKDDGLPEELKGKSATEIKKYVSEKKKEREQIQNKIQDLNEKRKVFISEQKTDAKNGLENAMTNAIKEQAKRKKYTWQ